MRIQPRLRRGAEQPFATELGRDLFVRNDPTDGTVSETTIDGLDDVEVVQDIVQAAIVGQSVEERAHGVFDGHSSLNKKNASSIRLVFRQAKSFRRGFAQQATARHHKRRRAIARRLVHAC